MKRIFTLVAAILMTATFAVAQQTFTVQEGSVAWRYDATALTSPMPFADGAVTIAGHTFALGSNVSMSTGSDAIEPLVVSIAYTASGVEIVAPGALAAQLDINVSGRNVDITAAPTLADEVTYRLSGSGESFALHGDYKASVQLCGVQLKATATQPALWIDCGKRIEFVVPAGTDNTFADAAQNEKKSAFFVKGHAEWKGEGNVSIAGTSRHAYSSNEYTLFKQSFTGRFAITAAGGDGMHVDQYLQVNGGTITVAGNKGDGIDVAYALQDDGKTPTADEQNGQFIMNGGSITVCATTDDTKGLKCEDKMTITAGRIDATAAGNGSRGISAGTDLYLGLAGADSKAAYVYLTATGFDFEDSATGEVNKCRGLKVKQNFYHYPSTVERNTASTVSKKKVVDVDGVYLNQGGTLTEITIQ